MGLLKLILIGSKKILAQSITVCDAAKRRPKKAASKRRCTGGAEIGKYAAALPRRFRMEPEPGKSARLVQPAASNVLEQNLQEETTR